MFVLQDTRLSCAGKVSSRFSSVFSSEISFGPHESDLPSRHQSTQLSCTSNLIRTIIALPIYIYIIYTGHCNAAIAIIIILLLMGRSLPFSSRPRAPSQHRFVRVPDGSWTPQQQCTADRTSNENRFVTTNI